MYIYVPQNIQPNAKLIVAIHGCTQSAAEYSTTSHWDSIAKKYNCIILYPEQQFFNNSSYCFNWFLSADQIKDSGEPLSIKQMIDYLKSNYSIDNSNVFVTGLSAGAGMTAIMMACYPYIFSKAAIFAGGPYKAASDALTAYSVMSGNVSKTPEEWKALVIGQNPSYTGEYPKLAIFHGLNDNTVSPNNVFELVKQWTAVYNTDTIRDYSSSNFFNNTDVTQSVYLKNSDTVVLVYKFNNLGHALAIDPGNCNFQGGTTNTYAVDKNFFSTYWVARFFGIINRPLINGPDIVSINQTNINYSIFNSNGSSYFWEVPSGADIISGQGTSSITANWANSSGFVYVTETDNMSCVNPKIQLYVNTTTNIDVIYDDNIISSYPNPADNIVFFKENLDGYVRLFNSSMTINDTIQIISNCVDVSSYSKGLYFLEFKHNKKIVVKKLIIN